MLRYSLYNEDQIREPDLPESYGSDNSTAADNQQERLSVSEKKCWFLAGLIEGEGSLCVSIKNHKPSRFGYLVHPEFFIYQHKIRRGLLELAPFRSSWIGRNRSQGLPNEYGGQAAQATN